MRITLFFYSFINHLLKFLFFYFESILFVFAKSILKGDSWLHNGMLYISHHIHSKTNIYTCKSCDYILNFFRPNAYSLDIAWNDFHSQIVQKSDHLITFVYHFENFCTVRKSFCYAILFDILNNILFCTTHIKTSLHLLFNKKTYNHNLLWDNKI